VGKIDYKTYTKERYSLIRSQVEQARQFDKYILALASGTFGFSVVFMRYIAPNPGLSTIPLITAALVNFGASIFSTLLSFLMSQKAIVKQLEITDLWYEKETELDEHESKNKFADWTARLNWISIILFVIGGVFLIRFVALNLLVGEV
jgi:hypothetical protein